MVVFQQNLLIFNISFDEFFFRNVDRLKHCAVPQNISILLPQWQKGLEFPGVGGSVRPKNLKKFRKRNWNFQRGGGS